MAHIDTQLLATVPKLHGGSDGSRLLWRDRLARALGRGAVGLVIAGIIATAGWAAFLAWCVFSLVQWAIG